MGTLNEAHYNCSINPFQYRETPLIPMDLYLYMYELTLSSTESNYSSRLMEFVLSQVAIAELIKGYSQYGQMVLSIKSSRMAKTPTIRLLTACMMMGAQSVSLRS